MSTTRAWGREARGSGGGRKREDGRRSGPACLARGPFGGTRATPQPPRGPGRAFFLRSLVVAPEVVRSARIASRDVPRAYRGCDDCCAGGRSKGQIHRRPAVRDAVRAGTPDRGARSTGGASRPLSRTSSAIRDIEPPSDRQSARYLTNCFRDDALPPRPSRALRNRRPGRVDDTRGGAVR